MVLDYDDEVEDLEAVDGLLGILMKRMWELQDSESCDDPYREWCEEVTAYIDSLYENEGVFHSDDPFYTDTLVMHYLAWVDPRDNLAKSMPTGVAKSYRNQTTNHIVNTLRYLHATSRKVLKTTIVFGNFLLLLCMYPLKRDFMKLFGNITGIQIASPALLATTFALAGASFGNEINEKYGGKIGGAVGGFLGGIIGGAIVSGPAGIAVSGVGGGILGTSIGYGVDRCCALEV